jgi:hypothetical protein
MAEFILGLRNDFPGLHREMQMEGIDLPKITRIIALRAELARKREELEGLVIQYIGLNPGVSWRKLAKRIRMNYTQLFKFAKKRGLRHQQ